MSSRLEGKNDKMPNLLDELFQKGLTLVDAFKVAVSEKTRYGYLPDGRIHVKVAIPENYTRKETELQTSRQSEKVPALLDLAEFLVQNGYKNITTHPDYQENPVYTEDMPDRCFAFIKCQELKKPYPYMVKTETTVCTEDNLEECTHVAFTLNLVNLKHC